MRTLEKQSTATLEEVAIATDTELAYIPAQYGVRKLDMGRKWFKQRKIRQRAQKASRRANRG